MQSFGFIGLGNMASAIVRGMLAGGFAKPEHVIAFRQDAGKLAAFSAETGIRAASSNEAVLSGSDMLILAVKPGMFASVLPPLRQAAQAKKPLIVSVAAGMPLERIDALLGGGLPIVRVMPNVNAAIGASMTGLCANGRVSDVQQHGVEQLFDALGRTLWLDDESMFGIFSAVAGASPAFAFMFIEGLAKAGLKAGMTKQAAVRAAAQAVMGSAQLVLESGQAPLALADSVCSPGGTTIAGVAALESDAFVATVMQAVEATDKRDKELAAASAGNAD